MTYDTADHRPGRESAVDDCGEHDGGEEHEWERLNESLEEIPVCDSTAPDAKVLAHGVLLFRRGTIWDWFFEARGAGHGAGYFTDIFGYDDFGFLFFVGFESVVFGDFEVGC